MRATHPRAAAIYCRISHDPSGERLGVRRQELDCSEQAQRRGWLVAEVYVDDDRSAYCTRKPRPEYQRLLRDIAAGRRDGVMIWRLDRLHRQPRELEEFIVLCDKHSVALATVTGDVDLSNSQGRLLARAWGAFAAHESEIKGERLSRAAHDRACRGLMPSSGATRPYGFVRGGAAIVPKEAAVLREAARRLLSGESLRSISMDYNRRRIPTLRGSKWQGSTLRTMLAHPRLAGSSTYHGEIVGKGLWKPILTKRESERVRALLSDPSRRSWDPAVRWHMLTGLVRCGRCGEGLRTRTRHGAPSYSCNRIATMRACGRVSIPAELLEQYTLDRMCERLASAELAAALQREQISSPQWRRAKRTRDQADAQLATLARAWAKREVTKREWTIARSELVAQLEASMTTMMLERTDTTLGDFLGNPQDLRAEWPVLDFGRRHAITKALLQDIVIWPASSTRPATVAERVSIWWRHAQPPQRSARRAERSSIAGKRAMGAFDACAVEGCPQPYKSNGYCNLHFQRFRSLGRPGEADRRRALPYDDTPCIVSGCPDRASSKARCVRHLQRVASLGSTRNDRATRIRKRNTAGVVSSRALTASTFIIQRPSGASDPSTEHLARAQGRRRHRSTARPELADHQTFRTVTAGRQTHPRPVRSDLRATQ